ncbi:DUF2163 domain-containing protein [Ahrensia marina]|uniref:Bacteriophage phiJL001 Gp84 C-terminal domain-containing protein n=1 Tax=Ahrensia marina TaxID=1514904 RepID=A0A0N0VM98_9HYPH|nr:DUF2163 domain-containing protein [Ahrensia marina]KPB02281.1 hypothetical protein SU32_03145 [Ahrensia marina]
MIEIGEALKEHLRNESATVCYVWIISRTDGVRLGFTDHDKSLTVDGVVCEPETGLNASALDNALGLSVETSEVSGALKSDRISEADIHARLYDNAEVFQWIVNWEAPEQQALIRKYRIGEITREGEYFKAELRSHAANLDQQSGRYFIKRCDADLGDQRCGVNVASPIYRAESRVLNDASNSVGSFYAEAIGQYADNWFSGGTLIWKTGNLLGQQYTIASAGNNGSRLEITVIEAMHLIPDAGAEFDIIAGCDKRFETCKAKFSNHINFRGFPHMPGNENALNYLDVETRLDGGPIVP